MEASLAFYRRLGVNLPEANVWRTASGAHHASVREGDADLDIDSARLRGDLEQRMAAAAAISAAASSWASASLRARRSTACSPS